MLHFIRNIINVFEHTSKMYIIFNIYIWLGLIYYCYCIILHKYATNKKYELLIVIVAFLYCLLGEVFCYIFNKMYIKSIIHDNSIFSNHKLKWKIYNLKNRYFLNSISIINIELFGIIISELYISITKSVIQQYNFFILSVLIFLSYLFLVVKIKLYFKKQLFQLIRKYNVYYQSKNFGMLWEKYSHDYHILEKHDLAKEQNDINNLKKICSSHNMNFSNLTDNMF